MNGIQQAFPQTPSPAQVVVTGADLTGPAMRDAIAALKARAAPAPIREPITNRPVAGGRALLIDVPLAGTGSGSVSNDALLSLRNHILPATLGKVRGVRYTVAAPLREITTTPRPLTRAPRLSSPSSPCSRSCC